MMRYIAKRFFHALLIVWGVLTLTFVIIHLAPGDPASIYIRPDVSPETVALIRRQLGLHLPLWQQYVHWIMEFAGGNFGVSFTHNRAVGSVLLAAVPNTLQLTLVVFFGQLLLGSALGLLTAIKRDTPWDISISSLLMAIYSTPSFWLSLMGILLFSLNLGWLPSSHMQSLNVTDGFMAQAVDRIMHLILPATVLILPFAAYTARFVRGSLSEVLQKNYIRTATAYGIPPTRVLWQYAFKNSMLPLVTLFGLYLPFLLGGAVVTEYIFSWPGMGRLTINAIFAHDYPIILAANFLAAIAVVSGNVLSDILYAVVDPRIRIEP